MNNSISFTVPDLIYSEFMKLCEDMGVSPAELLRFNVYDILNDYGRI